MYDAFGTFFAFIGILATLHFICKHGEFMWSLFVMLVEAVFLLPIYAVVKLIGWWRK